MKILLPKNALPDNKPLRRKILDDYFPSDLVPLETLENNQWKIISFIPKDPGFYVDPFIEKKLYEFDKTISIEWIGYYWKVYKNSMLSLNDSWSVYYWSLVLNWLKSEGRVPDNIILFHVDDHKDTGSPILAATNEGYECLFSKKTVSFENPETIRQAIVDKSINIRSLITPLLHAVDSVNLLHLQYSRKTETERFGLFPEFEPDTLISPGKLRPITQFKKQDSKHTYCTASDIFYLTQQIPNDSLIFLHIDCDGFNNRYNGNSKWDSLNSSIDMNLGQIKHKIDELLNAISQTSSEIFMNVALSPGFFPSEYWIDVLKHLFAKAEENRIVKEGCFTEYLKQIHPKEILNDFFN